MFYAGVFEQAGKTIRSAFIVFGVHAKRKQISRPQRGSCGAVAQLLGFFSHGKKFHIDQFFYGSLQHTIDPFFK
jgi:hypothetical protein